MSVKNNVLAIEMTSIDSATLTPSPAYQVINAGGLDESCFMIRIINDSNSDVMISYDGVTDNDFIIAGQTLQLESQTNSQPNNKLANFQKGLVVYAAGTAGVGTIYLVGYYQPKAN